MTKHTPGPWDWLSIADDFYAICYGLETIADTQTIHNARLIAAAPELLEALIAAQSLLRKCHEEVRMSLNDIERAAATDAMASIRAALAKATGEQQ
jgi:hypothetical protein